MANRDIAGLLTGIPSGGIDPTVGMSGNQMIAQAAAQGRQMMGRGVRGLMGGDRRTVEERQIDKVKSQQKAFATYLSSNYPNSGLDVLATEGVVTPANFKDFLAEKQGANARQGKRYTIRDEEGNMFAATTSFSNVTSAFETIYAPLGTTTSDEPIGDIEIITEAGVSFAEKEEAKIESSKQINSDRKFSEAQLEALQAKGEVDGNLIGLQESLELVDSVRQGGPIANITLSVQKFLGTTPADKAELEFRLATRMLSNLKSTFGGVISEGERTYLREISPDITKGNDANRAILETLLEIAQRAKVRNDLLLSANNFEEYKQTTMGYGFKDPVVNEDEDENVIDFGDL
jgi:hypothetical protein